MLQYLKELALISRKADTKLGKIIEIAKNSSLKDVNVVDLKIARLKCLGGDLILWVGFGKFAPSIIVFITF